jgi:outer membrane protein OmpA-like peptidoglycan-associated protein
MRLSQWFGLCAGAIGALAAWSNSAQAQAARGFALDRFDPSERGSEWYANETLDFRGHLRPALGLTANYTFKPLVIYNSDDSEAAALVKQQLMAHLGGSLILFNRLRLGLNLPIAMLQDGTAWTSGTTSFPPGNSTALGDVRLGVDARLFGNYKDPFTVALGAQVYLPTGNRDQYMSDGQLRLTPRLTVAGTISIFTYAAKVGFAWRPQNDTFGGVVRGDEVVYSAAAGVRVLDNKLVVGPEIFGARLLADPGASERQATPTEVLLGVHYTAGNVRFGLGGGFGITRGLGAAKARALATVEWAPAYVEKPKIADSDGDGIPDNEDACPTVAGVRTSDPKTNGCPLVADRDQDGIPDAEDACPAVPGIKTSDPKTNGCPAPTDKDGDGIVDSEDACPEVAGVKTDDPKTNGCPADRDKDGVPDAVDMCPDVPGQKSDNAAFNGCPADIDGDQILNEQDACPREPGKPSTDPKKNGCPTAFITATSIEFSGMVNFQTGSAVLANDAQTKEILESVLKILQGHPEITVVRVEGHTDNVGAKAGNKVLSQMRANAVVAWLTRKGIDKKRLTSAGFGDEKPIADNKTTEGKRQNRRVQFEIAERANP